MKSIYTLFFLLLLFGTVSAQQLPQHTQYTQNNFLLNPAVAGIENYIDLRTSYRTQWVGLEGAPTSFYTSLHSSINKNDRNTKRYSLRNGSAGKGSGANKNNRFYIKPHHGIGAIAQVDKAGLLNTFSLSMSYAYHLPLTKNLNMSAGVTAGFKQLRLNRKALDVLTPEDPFLAGDAGHMNKADLGVGFWIYSSNFYVGFSGMQLLRGGKENPGAEPSAALQQHYYATGGIRIRASELITVTPSVMVKTAENGLSMVDANAKVIYGDRFWLGTSYRHNDALTGTVGFYLNHMLDVSYSYDITTSDLNRVSANSHEVVVGLKLNNKQKVLCPKWIW
ncbi:PorP/SprF family type IX secretion system membrane protein [Pontibacter cellulosilyticus]|uniref:Type IX secretion system membrane protein PorP/SprF n=1 Tax=Pontibacter cellulosilyticus TaxID=1720253 RepID=A0A923NAJ5_9BACT|nr:type IX secretion system membrane protein PorP/SprF [Pontibacter cellulosilyticus]MBC5993410.1 type IX secretion system membrane protein PorP/SprF [Pontibacter cellulosilyticus]